MRSIIKHLAMPALLVLLVATITACNKENLESEKAFHVLINGYNGGSNPLRVTIDTTKFNHNNYLIKPTAIIGFNVAYTYWSQKERLVNIIDTVTKKVILSKPLPATGTKANFNFIYLDNALVEVNPPAANPATNKLGFYMQYTVDNTPFDIFISRTDATTGTEYRQYLARDVKPKNWIYVDYIPTADFANVNFLNTSTILFTKAGTTDQWAFMDSESMSKISATGLNLPLAGEKGLVQPYFLIPGPRMLEYARLFFSPDRN